MRVLVACEFSGRVRDAFLAAGHDALSVDLEGTERPGPHWQGDVRDVLGDGWDLMIAHPPCRYLAVSGARWFSARRREQEEALEFVRVLMAAPIDRIAIENPVSVIATRIGPATQYVEPWMFGDGECKRTGLWLQNLPRLVPTLVVPGRDQRVHRLGPSAERWRERSRTPVGMAAAMAAQWGSVSTPVQLRWSA